MIADLLLLLGLAALVAAAAVLAPAAGLAVAGVVLVFLSFAFADGSPWRRS